MKKLNLISFLLFSVFIWCGLSACQSGAHKQEQKANALTTVKEADMSHPVIIEIIAAEKGEVDSLKLKRLKKECGILNEDILHWNNHTVIYVDNYEPQKVLKRTTAIFPEDSIKVYDKAFYRFDRKRCDDPSIVKGWKSIILTANLVKDEKLQQEYLDYHKTQFEKWPEVSKGFCNASFQQLLVFKNGRQLMLVISIPERKTLDELNPLTTKNNPRVDEWNKLMAKYQEGIPGTKPGEVWVFLKPHIN